MPSGRIPSTVDPPASSVAAHPQCTVAATDDHQRRVAVRADFLADVRPIHEADIRRDTGGSERLVQRRSQPIAEPSPRCRRAG